MTPRGCAGYQVVMPARTVGLLLLLAVLAACDGITRPDLVVVSNGDDSQIPESLRVVYREDAARLALRHLEATGDPARSDVELPATLVGSLYSALVHVYNARDLPARDSVVDLYAVHTFPVPEVLRLTLGVDSTAAWVQALRSEQVPTGNERFDELVDAHDLGLERYYDLRLMYDVVTLRAATPLNTIALAPLFRDIEGVLTADPSGWAGDGNDIRATAEADGWRLAYSRGFGDCPAGCTGRYTWIFRVFADGRVSYEGAAGGAPPPPGKNWP